MTSHIVKNCNTGDNAIPATKCDDYSEFLKDALKNPLFRKSSLSPSEFLTSIKTKGNKDEDGIITSKQRSKLKTTKDRKRPRNVGGRKGLLPAITPQASTVALSATPSFKSSSKIGSKAKILLEKQDKSNCDLTSHKRQKLAQHTNAKDENLSIATAFLMDESPSTISFETIPCTVSSHCTDSFRNRDILDESLSSTTSLETTTNLNPMDFLPLNECSLNGGEMFLDSDILRLLSKGYHKTMMTKDLQTVNNQAIGSNADDIPREAISSTMLDKCLSEVQAAIKQSRSALSTIRKALPNGNGDLRSPSRTSSLHLSKIPVMSSDKICDIICPIDPFWTCSNNVVSHGSEFPRTESLSSLVSLEQPFTMPSWNVEQPAFHDSFEHIFE